MSMRYPGGFIASTPVTAAYPSGVWTQAQAIPYQAQNVWTRDQYWPYTTLLLQGNGTNGAQNNTFLDSSSNNFTITRNGNTTQGSFTPYEANGYWSYAGSTSTAYLQVGSNAALQFGTGDFTIECWAYFTTVGTPGSGENVLLDFRPTSTQGAYPCFYLSNQTILLEVNSGALLTTSTVPINQWIHIAWVRSSGVSRVYINGVQSGTSASDTTNYTCGSTNRIGNTAFFSTGNRTFNGFISNMRLVKGTAVYTSAFTPPVSPLTAISGTSLLTCQSNRFIDNSSNAFAITVNSTPSVQAFQPFPGATTYSGTVLSGSGYFDGTGDYLTLPVNSAFDLGLNACCVEAWVYLTNNNEMALFSTSVNVNGQTRPNFYVKFNQIQLDFFNNVVIQANVTVPLNCWNHVAFTRASSSGPWRIFLNGVLQAYNATGSQNLLQTGAAQDVNRLYGGTTGQGYMCDLRIVNGSVPSAYVTSSTTIGATIFTPPTTPLAAITNTSLLLSYTNAGIFDAAVMNDLETVGNAQVSTSVVKYGTGSLAFDGNGDWLQAPDSPIQELGSGDFTIELWAYLNSLPSSNNGSAFIAKWNSTNSSFLSAIYNNGGTMQLSFSYTTNGTNTTNIRANANIATSTWYHIAFVRNGSSFKIFLNGVEVTSSATISGTLFNGTEPLAVGRTGDGFNYLNGNIDDLRITTGVARYITNFTPPIARLPAQ